MSAERGWIADPPIPRANAVQDWVEKHRALGHHPYPAPTTKNPEQWECKCDSDSKWTAVWRIMTAEQLPDVDDLARSMLLLHGVHDEVHPTGDDGDVRALSLIHI